MLVPTLLSTLSWLGFITSGFVLWSYGNTNGGYSMVGIATILPSVVALITLIRNAYVQTQFVRAIPLLLTLSWLGFIVSGFMLWYYGNTGGGYSMVGIAIILPAVVAVALAVAGAVKRGSGVPLSPGLVYLLTWLATLTWAGFLVCGFVLWYYGNTNGGYSMVGIAICLPAAVATGLYLQAWLTSLPTHVVVRVTDVAAVPVPATAPSGDAPVTVAAAVTTTVAV